MDTDELMDARLRAAGERWRSTVQAVDPKASTPAKARRIKLAPLLTAAAIVAALVVAGGLLLPRGSGTHPAGGSASLIGVHWSLQTYSEADGASLQSMRSAYIKFGKSDVLGNDGCNTFSGPVRIQAHQVNFGGLATTAIGCLNSNPWATFDAVLAVGHASWVINTDVLTLSNAKGTLTFRPQTPTPPAALVGSYWNLTTIGDGTVASTVNGQTLLVIQGGKYLISHACYELDGSAAVQGQQLVLGPGTQHPHRCPAGAGGPDDAKADRILTGTVTWSVQGASLTITKPGVGFVSFAREPTPAPSPTAKTK